MPRVNGEPTIALAGGGSGGHLYPALAVADMLRSLVPNLRVLFFGTRRPIDSEILSAYSGRLVRQSVRPFPRRPWNVPGFLMGWWRSTRACARTLDDNPPLAVLGTGGYASAPAIVAAAKAGIPTALLNPDAVPGKANRMLGSRVDAVFAQWAETQEHFNGSSSVHVTGCPIRPEFKTATRDEGIEHFGLDPDRKVLLVTGASQGARSVNEAVTAAVPLLHERRIWDDWQLLHLTGIRDEPRIVETYDALDFRAARVVGYTKHMAAALAAADLIVSRSGASTLAEITAMGRASVLMPDRKSVV